MSIEAPSPYYLIVEEKCRSCHRLLTLHWKLDNINERLKESFTERYCSHCRKYTFRDVLSQNFYEWQTGKVIAEKHHLRNPTVFLDIDGVLRVEGFDMDRDDYGHLFNSLFVDNLHFITVNTNADIVICGSWKKNGLVALQEMWKHRDLPSKVVGITPDLDIENASRGLEVLQYCAGHKIDRYIIIDDEADYLPFQMKYLVRTSPVHGEFNGTMNGFGLSQKRASKAVKLLNW